MYYMVVKVERIHSLPGGVTSWWFWHTGELCKNGWTDQDATWGAALMWV